MVIAFLSMTNYCHVDIYIPIYVKTPAEIGLLYCKISCLALRHLAIIRLGSSNLGCGTAVNYIHISPKYLELTYVFWGFV